MKRLHRLLATGTAAALAVTLASCASSDRTTDSSTSSNETTTSGGAAAPDTASSGDATTPSPSGEPASTDGTFIFGTAGEPAMFDPLLASDGETFRVTRQITEGLISYTPGTTDMAPGLAESWEASDDSLTWTFTLRDGVKFSDGTDFNGEAVCFNLDRMYNLSGPASDLATYWSDTMGGFAGSTNEDGSPKPTVYGGCEAPDAGTAVITLTRGSSKFPSILGLPSFSIQSPTALTQYDANNVTGDAGAYIYPEYALAHPTGTGPFVFDSYDTANGTVTLLRNEDYWGEKAKIKTLIFKIIKDETARKSELQAGTIDGYDFPAPADWEPLKADGYQVLVRPAFNIMYLGLNPKDNPALLDLNVRKAIAYAINREEFVSSQLPEGATVAQEFYPDTVDGWTGTVEQYPYDPEKAKQLLAAAGQSNFTLQLWWPTEVSRPYMPDPQAAFESIAADLTAVGITVEANPVSWAQGYITRVDQQEAQAFILGWTGDYNSPDNFIGTFFSNTESRFGTQYYDWGTTLSEELAAADTEADPETRTSMYVTLNEKIMSEYLPGVPISHSPPAMIVAANVQGIVPSPLTDEGFVGVYKTS